MGFQGAGPRPKANSKRVEVRLGVCVCVCFTREKGKAPVVCVWGMYVVRCVAMGAEKFCVKIQEDWNGDTRYHTHLQGCAACTQTLFGCPF